MKTDFGLTVYYLRHAETGQNVYSNLLASGTPVDQWPSWVGNCDVFSPEGEEQVRGVTAKLLAYQFDFIAVGPAWRTRQTILPFLKATGRTAEVWPELAEVVQESTLAESVPSELVVGHVPIEVPQDEQAWFKLRPDPSGRYELLAETMAQANGQAKQILKMLRDRFEQRAVTVLLVGHSGSGRTLIRHLTRQPEWKETWLRNASLWMASEQMHGAFDLKLLNGMPYPAETL